MAWLDDRAWCHPKLVNLSDRAFRAYVNGIAYSAGMATRGHLTLEQQKLVGATPRVKKELIISQLWAENGAGGVRIHDWDDHNGKRDDRREKDRERKRLARAAERQESAGASAGQSVLLSLGTSAGQSAGASRGPSAGTARVEGSEGSEGKNSVSPSALRDPGGRTDDLRIGEEAKALLGRLQGHA